MQKPYESLGCVFVSLAITFLDSAYTLWWCAFSYVWYLSASKKWSTEALEKISSRVHVTIWTTSLVPIICALFSNKIKVNDFTGFCEFSTYVLPTVQLVLVLVGAVMVIKTLLALRNVRKALIQAGRSPVKLERLIYRFFIITIGICVPFVVSLICNFFDNFTLDLLKIGFQFTSFTFATFWVFSSKTFKSWNKILRYKMKDKTVIMPITKV